MASVAKIIDKMKRQPKGIRFEEAEKVLNHMGYKLGNRKGKGSHRVFRNDEGKHLSVPYKNPIDKAYSVILLSAKSKTFGFVRTSLRY